MEEKFHNSNGLCKSEHNIKSDSHLATLVSNKISQEIIELKNNNHTKNSDAISSSDEGKNPKLVIAKCKGLLGIQFCDNIKSLDISVLDDVILNIGGTYEFANIVEIGEIVNLRNYNIDAKTDEHAKIDRLANELDYEKNVNNSMKSIEAKSIFIDYVKQLSLEMKLVDVHYQFDGKKIFFFYTADGRVDFRELAKKLAGYFRTRIELRQIGVRDEAKIIGGIATCGREFCCASFMCSFKKVTAEDAYKNNITSNISNYTGPCGKLKCCLTYDI